MQISFNPYISSYVAMGGKQNFQDFKRAEQYSSVKQEKELSVYLESLKKSKHATIPPLNAMKGVNPNSKNVFDTFNKIDDVTRSINFVRTQDAWDDCLLEEMQEFTVARREYQQNPNKQNFDHMEEEMGDIFYTAASIAKDSGINPEEAFRSTIRKFFNRINIMERILKDKAGPEYVDLKDCRDYERRALWNAAKRKIYDAQSLQYQIET